MVEAVLSTPEEVAAALSPTDPVTAVELPGGNTNVPKRSRKRSRIHDVFEEDPTDSNYSICKCEMPAVRERPCVRRTHQERMVTQRASEPCGEETPVRVRKVGAAAGQSG